MSRPLVVCYSPRPPTAYARQGPDGPFGVGVELAKPQHAEWWNLYWLSEPHVDAYLEPDDAWMVSPPAHPDMLSASMWALNQTLGGMSVAMLMRRPPADFVHRLKGLDYKHLHTFRCGGERWLEIVRRRAAAARHRLRQEDSVVYANFGGRPTFTKNETAAKYSATIMTLSLRKF